MEPPTKEYHAELLHRDALLSAANEVAAMFLGNEKIDVAHADIERALAILCNALGVGRAFFWRNERGEDGMLLSRQIAVWDKGGASIGLEIHPFKNVLANMPGVHGEESLDVINMLYKDIPTDAVDPVKTAGMKSLLVIPIHFAGAFWGFITFEDYENERLFLTEDEEIVASAGRMVANALIRFEEFRQLVQAREEAQRATAAKSEFLARMSHEIRTPLNAVIGLTTLAQKTNDAEKIKMCLEKLSGSSRQLLGIINDVLDMSKIESDKFEINEVEFRFSKLIDRVCNVIQIKIDEKHQRFIQALDYQSDIVVVGDDLRLAQVLINLLNNAVKFTPEFGEIEMRVEIGDADDGELRLYVEIRDSGIGISEAQQQKLFRLFEQADGSISRKFGGSGLGLAISKKIVSLMGGDIGVRSREGEGAVFYFDVPLRRAVTSYKLTQDGTPARDGDCDWTGKRILLVEDIEVNREIVVGLLESTGVEIDAVENGQIAVEKFKNDDRYDIILMDMQMPVMDGLEATRKIREMMTRKALTIPILAMTANAFKDDQERCLSAGMNAHIPKPVEYDVLIDTISQYMY